MDKRVSQFKEIFLGLERAYGTFQPKDSLREDNKAEGETWIRKKPLEDKLWQDHLEGAWPSLGVFPINDEDKCRWGCIDVDEYPLDHVSIAKKLSERNLPFIVTKSKSGGAHIFLFFKDYVPAGIVHNKIKELAAFMGLGHCEVFPKQEKLMREGNQADWEVGSFLNMPYHNGLEHTERYAFSGEGNVLTLEEFLTGPYQTELQAYELLTKIKIPILGNCYYTDFKKIGRRKALSIARLSLALVTKIDEVGIFRDTRIVPGSATPYPQSFPESEKAVNGKSLYTIDIEKISQITSNEMISITGERWSTPYKKPTIEVLIQRALEKVIGEAKIHA